MKFFLLNWISYLKGVEEISTRRSCKQFFGIAQEDWGVLLEVDSIFWEHTYTVFFAKFSYEYQAFERQQ